MIITILLYQVMQEKADKLGWNKKLYSNKSIKKFKNKKIKMIPYFLWANRKVGEMKVWFVKN